jgi:hypothetical protein
MDAKPQDELLLPYLNELVSFMIVLPDNPELEYLGLYNGVYSIVEIIKWYYKSSIIFRNPKNGGILQLQLLINFMQYLCTSVQERLPYHVEGVKSNDSLFNKDDEFKIKIVEKV